MGSTHSVLTGRSISLEIPKTGQKGDVRKGFILAAIANLIWGTSFLASKATLGFWGPFTASALRFTLAIVAMVVLFPLLNRSISIPRTRGAITRILLVGLTGFGFLYPLQLQGLREIPSSLSASIMLTSPLFVLLMATGMLKESLSKAKIVAIAMGIAGGILLINPMNTDMSTWGADAFSHLIKGSLLTLLASASLAASVIATRASAKDLDTYSLTFWSMVIGLLFLLPFAVFETTPVRGDGSLAVGVMALMYLALICSVVAFLIWNYAITLAPPQNLASPMHIKTPVAVLIGVGFANEPLTFAVVAGTISVSLAVWISQTSKK
jgi:drug/metabolite transporter (DMT)-like permease